MCTVQAVSSRRMVRKQKMLHMRRSCCSQSRRAAPSRILQQTRGFDGVLYSLGPLVTLKIEALECHRDWASTRIKDDTCGWRLRKASLDRASASG